MYVKAIQSMFAGERESFYNGLAYPVIVETGRHPISSPKVVRLSCYGRANILTLTLMPEATPAFGSGSDSNSVEHTHCGGLSA